jgi:predicted NBD/HSP70 family sugar kinase
LIRFGIDLGGTKIELIALDDAGRTLLRTRVATPPGYDATLAALHALVTSGERQLAATATIGISMPGSVSLATGLIRNANSTWLNGTPFVDDLSARLARPVRVANDANCFALSEAIDGAGAGHRVVFGVILGTGVGGGLAIDGACLTGRNAIAGEWGHNALPRPDDADRPSTACWCGRRDCIETWLSGPALLADHRRHGGEAVDAADVAARALRGEPSARATMQRYARRLAKSLASVINLLDPDIVVLGGGVSNIDWLYEALPALLAEHVFCDTVTTPIVKNRHGDSSGVRGAAWLWPKG